MYVLFGHSAHYILKQGLSFNLEFTDLARLTGQPASHRSSPFPLPQHWDYGPVPLHPAFLHECWGLELRPAL